MKTSQESTGLTPEQALSWLILEGFSVWKRNRTATDFTMVARNHKAEDAAICRSRTDMTDPWEFVGGMLSVGDIPGLWEQLEPWEYVAIYEVEQTAYATGYRKRVKAGDIDGEAI